MSIENGLQYKIECSPDYSFATIQVPANETLLVEASSMASMSSNMKMKTKMKGGFGRMFRGENLFINEFTAENGPGEIGIAPGCAGDMRHIYLNNETLYLQNSAFVASTMGIKSETKFQGLIKGFFSGERLFIIKCSGTGDLWFNSFGAILEIDVQDKYVVDTGYIVAFTEGLDYSVRPVGGLKSFFFSKEGLVCQFKGTGKVWIQTRQVLPFVAWADQFRIVKSNG